MASQINILLILVITVLVPVWLVFHFMVGRRRERRRSKIVQMRANKLQVLQGQFDVLEQRLRDMESCVTSPSFELEREINNLKE